MSEPRQQFDGAADLTIASQATEIVRLTARVLDLEQERDQYREMVEQLLALWHRGTKPGFPAGLGEDALNAAAKNVDATPIPADIRWEAPRVRLAIRVAIEELAVPERVRRVLRLRLERQVFENR